MDRRANSRAMAERADHLAWRRRFLPPQLDDLARGKPRRFCLFADRTRCRTMRANQLRLWLSNAAYVLLQVPRQHGLKETPLAAARCDTIRLKLLKIGAIVRVSIRRVWFSLAHSYPYQTLSQLDRTVLSRKFFMRIHLGRFRFCNGTNMNFTRLCFLQNAIRLHHF